MGFLIFFNPLQRLWFGEKAKPREVTARGDLAADEQNTIDVFKKNSPSVVFVTSIALKRSFFSLNAVEIPQGTGTGFIWDEKGRIVTNYHVIRRANEVKVTMTDNSTWNAVLVGASPDKDIAVLKINAPAHRLRPISIGTSSDLQVGQKVFAIGNPFGFDQTITSGIISALNREIKAITGRTIRGVIQTDAAINPGNSGGPLLDSAGRLIGVNTAIYSPSGAYAGIGFAVEVDIVNRIVPQLIRDGRIRQPGILASFGDDRITEQLGIEGVIIVDVVRGGPAAKAGLRPTTQYGGEVILGDIIIGVDDIPVKSYSDLQAAFEQYEIGDKVTLIIVREGKLHKIAIRLEAID